MTASSQTPPGPQPPELSLVRPPLPDAERAAFAAYGVAIPAPAGPAVQNAPTPSVQMATGVIRAAMANGSATASEIAQAEHDAGILFDPERVQAIASASYAQARAEDQAELAIAEQDRETLLWLRDRWRAVGRLCEGRPDTDLVTVREVLTATDGAPPTGAPLALTWDGPVMGPSGDTPRENTLIPATTARGGRAALVLDDEQRLMLGGLLLAHLHTAGRCTTAGCGTGAADLDASDPELWGWVLVDVAGSEGGARWWCNPLCAQAAIAAAGAELAAADQLAADDPDAPIPFLDTSTVADDLDARYGPGASDEYALQVAEATAAGFEDERGDTGEGW